MRLHLRPLGVGQNEAIHPQLESHQAPAVNLEGSVWSRGTQACSVTGAITLKPD
jgi:hypothetical protein